MSATLAIYWQDLVAIFNEALHSELATHILAIPFLFVYMLYRKRKMLRTVISLDSKPGKGLISTNEIVGSLLFLLSFFTYWHGSYTFYPLEHHLISLTIFVAGCTLIIFNAKTLKTLAFPIAFLLFLTPPPLEIIYAAGVTLSTVSSEAACNFLKAIGLPVSLADQYGTPAIILQRPEGLPLTFAVDIACAGVYSLMGFAVFAVFASYIVRGAAWKKAATFLIGFPLIYALNITRIIIVVLIGSQFGMEAAMQVFHLFGGWILIFSGTLLLLYLSEKLWKTQIFAPKGSPILCPECNQTQEKRQGFCLACGRLLKYMNAKIHDRDIAKIAALIVSANLILLLEVPVFALTEGPAKVDFQSPTGGEVSTELLPQIPDYTLQFVYRDRRFEEVAAQDASLIYAYGPTNGSKTKIWVTVELANTRSALHRWEVCLITWPQEKGYQPQATQLGLREVQLLENPPLIGRYFAFTKSNITQVVLYWFEKAIFDTGSGFQQEYAKISLIAYPNSPEDVSRTEDQLLPFAQAIVNYWQPIKTWSWVALTLGQNGNALIAITVALLGIVIGFRIIEDLKGRKSNLKVYSKLVPEEKVILRAVHQAAKEEKPSTHAIASSYRELTQKPIRLDQLFKTLKEAEDAGLVKREIISRNDEPTLVWKTKIPFP